MLELDRAVAKQRDLKITVIEASMDSLPMPRDGQFDAVIHPVSTRYLPDIQPVFREVARVTRSDGLYISQHKQPAQSASVAYAFRAALCARCTLIIARPVDP